MTTETRIDNPHNRPIPNGAPTRIIMPDGRMYYASWSRPEWRDIRNNCWIDELPADAAAALNTARRDA